ncbi:MAG TPA: acetate kinase [Nitriliruptoraceae bacterium]|nr:acetate kinase [Nitriliruptoraceae bacterium]
MSQVLVLNTGSSSVKFELFEEGEADLESRARGIVEGIGEEEGAVTVTVEPPESSEDAADAATRHAVAVDRADGPRTVEDHATALEIVIEVLDAAGTLTDLAAIGHRVVHGGEAFRDPTVITDDVVAQLEELSPLAPLHNPPALVGIRVGRRLWPQLPHVAVFDTAFHATMPPEAYRYAVPDEWYRDHGVRRFGFHGTSHQYVAGRAAAVLGKDLADLRLITLHLGNGASAAAIDRGRVIDTSMGMSPLEGLVMGTRPGDLDPGVIFHMLRSGLSVEELEREVNRSSGLKGLAGRNDVRALRRAAVGGDPAATLALEVMTRRVRGYIGAYWAHLGGVDAVVFTGGIGEHDAVTRAEIIEPLAHMGLVLDRVRNESVDLDDGPAVVSAPDSATAVLVVATAEELVIAQSTLAVL